MARHFLFALILVTTIALPGFAQEAEIQKTDWTGWRGPTANGLSTETGLPVEWGVNDVTWKRPLKGEGQSSPTVLGERIFLTASLNKGRERVVMCVNRNDGETMWERAAWTGEPNASHRMNGWASATCATDGERVYTFFGKGGLHCYSIQGERLWTKDLGVFQGPWGTAACPVLYKNLVIQNCDADADSYLIGLNKLTGEQVWRTKRPNYRGWSTPVLVQVDGHDELVLNGTIGVRGYDPATGKELWFCKGYRGRGSPTVLPLDNGLVFVVCGRPSDVFTVKPGGKGDVKQTWHTPRGGGRDLPSPIAVDGQILVANSKGIVTAYAPKDGKELWKGRVDGSFSAAPVAYEGLAFFTAENGITTVIKPGKELNVIARNELEPADDEIFRASPIPSDGQVFIRSTKMLYCIGKRKPRGS